MATMRARRGAKWTRCHTLEACFIAPGAQCSSVSAAIVPVLFLYKLYFHHPGIQYAHLLVTYHFGFAKRALVGAVVALFADKVPIAYVYIIGLAAWLAALFLFLLAFKRIFGFSEKTLPLLAFVAGSPFFFKNFMYSIGYFDIYGCIVALGALVLPVSALYPLVLAAGCVILVLIHPIHFLLYCPVVALILFVRYYCVFGSSALRIGYGLILASVVLIIFLASVFFGRMPVPPETWHAYVQGRATVPVDPNLSYIWYSTISEEISRTWNVIGNNALRLPIYAVLIALHLPVARYFKTLVKALTKPSHRIGVVVGMSCDLRWLSNHLHDRVRLFALVFKLGGLHVPHHVCHAAAAFDARQLHASHRSGYEAKPETGMGVSAHSTRRDHETFLTDKHDSCAG